MIDRESLRHHLEYCSGLDLAPAFRDRRIDRRTATIRRCGNQWFMPLTIRGGIATVIGRMSAPINVSRLETENVETVLVGNSTVHDLLCITHD